LINNLRKRKEASNPQPILQVWNETTLLLILQAIRSGDGSYSVCRWLWQLARPRPSRSAYSAWNFIFAHLSFICEGTLTKRQRSDLFGLRAKLPPDKVEAIPLRPA